MKNSTIPPMKTLQAIADVAGYKLSTSVYHVAAGIRPRSGDWRTAKPIVLRQLFRAGWSPNGKLSGRVALYKFLKKQAERAREDAAETLATHERLPKP